MKLAVFEARLAEALKTRKPLHAHNETWNGKASKNYTFLVEVKDQPRAVVTIQERFTLWDGTATIRKSRLVTQKFLCAGGPCAGKWKTEDFAGDHGYVRYAAASFGSGHSRIRNASNRNILVHSSLWSAV